MFVFEGKPNFEFYGEGYNGKQLRELEEIACIISNYFDGKVVESDIDDLTIELYEKGVRISKYNTLENHNKLIDLCENILTIAYDTNNNELEQLAHELKTTLKCEYEEE